MANKLSVYVLLDRSGSMGGQRWTDAIGSINEYVSTLKANDAKGKVTVAAFDSGGGIGQRYYPSSNHTQFGVGRVNPTFPTSKYNQPSHLDFTVMRDTVKLKNFKPLESTELSPRGGTPLYDATGELLNLAEANNAEKTVILIMTDGGENSSQEYTSKSIKDRLTACTNRGWEVVFLGAEFNSDETARTLGIDTSKVINNARSADMVNTMAYYADATVAYTSGKAIDTREMRTKLASESKSAS